MLEMLKAEYNESILDSKTQNRATFVSFYSRYARFVGVQELSQINTPREFNIEHRSSKQ